MAKIQVWDIYEQMIKDPGHLLVAGATGSGKSVLLNNLLFTYQQMTTARAFIIDLKRVEYVNFNNVEIAKTETEAINLLHRISAAMDNRYREMENARQKKSTRPKILLIIDELADLLQFSHQRAIIYKLLVHLLRLGRAANIKIICATQSPNRKTLPADVQLNIVNRVALNCSSAIESRQIIYSDGAETLPRYGKAIWYKPENRPGVLINIPLYEELEY